MGERGVLGGPVFPISENLAAVVSGTRLNDFSSITISSIAYDAAVVSRNQSTFEVFKESLEEIVSGFSLPAYGINWGKEHSHRAVDIAARCGSLIFAAGPGRVVEVRDGWNGGYGNYIDIDHGSGVVTRYAHNQKNIAVEGQMVEVGDPIGYVGNTGESTGCHVHFEVRGGAPNPFVKH